MTRGVPVLDPARDLKGATPEKLARALFRRVVPLRPGRVRKPVAGDEVAIEEVAPDDDRTLGEHSADGNRKPNMSSNRVQRNKPFRELYVLLRHGLHGKF